MRWVTNLHPQWITDEKATPDQYRGAVPGNMDSAKLPMGFVVLREGPGTRFKMIAKLKPGFPLDADTGGGLLAGSKWTRVWIAARRSAWVYSKYTQPRDCPED
jgi:hypothetical protein